MTMSDMSCIFCISWAYGFTPWSPEWKRAREIVTEREGNMEESGIECHRWWNLDLFCASCFTIEERQHFEESIKLALEDELFSFQERAIGIIARESKLSKADVVQLISSNLYLKLYSLDTGRGRSLLPQAKWIISHRPGEPLKWTYGNRQQDGNCHGHLAMVIFL
jgi:hypothetical protein